MTLSEFAEFAKTKKKLVILVCIACVLCGCLLGAYQAKYGANFTAKTTIYVANLADNSAASLLSTIESAALTLQDDTEWSKVRFEVEKESAQDAIAISASAPTEEESIQAANGLAHKATELAEEELQKSIEHVAGLIAQALPEDFSLIRDDPSMSMLLNSLLQEQGSIINTSIISIREASLDRVKGWGIVPTVASGSLFGLLVGLFLSVCLLLLINLVKKPIRSGFDVKRYSDSPILECARKSSPSDALFAFNLWKLSSSKAKTVCLLPIGSAHSVEIVDNALHRALKNDKGDIGIVFLPQGNTGNHDDLVTMYSSKSSLSSIEGVQAAQLADAAVLCISKWADTEKQLDLALNEISLLDIKMVCSVITD